MLCCDLLHLSGVGCFQLTKPTGPLCTLIGSVPADLSPDLANLRLLLRFMRVPTMAVPGYEADDVSAWCDRTDRRWSRGWVVGLNLESPHWLLGCALACLQQRAVSVRLKPFVHFLLQVHADVLLAVRT